MGTARLCLLGVACAVVLATATRAQENGAIRVRLTFPRHAAPSAAEHAAARIALDRQTLDLRLSTDLAFVVEGVAAGEHALGVRVPRFEPLERRVRVVAGQTTEVECPLVLGIVLEGRVVDADGAAVRGALVTIVSATPARRDMRTATATGGAFRFAGVPAGAITLRARVGDREGDVLDLGAVAPSECRGELELRVETHGSVTGLVRDAKGRPVRGARVVAEGESSGGTASGRTDADGRFDLGAPGPGPFHVQAQFRDFNGEGTRIASARGVRPGTPLELTLALAGSIEVIVLGPPQALGTACVARDAAGRIPWREFLLDEDLRSLAGVFATEGGHRVYSLEPGAYGVEVFSLDGTRAAWRGVEVNPGAETRVEIVLEPATLLAVRAFEDGVAVPAWVTVVDEAGLRRQVDHGVDVALGVDSTAQLPPGAYRIHAERDGRTGTAEVVLDGEAEREVRIDLR